MKTGLISFKNSSMCLLGGIIFMTCILLSLWAVLIHFNLTEWNWPYWRGGVIVMTICLLRLYIRAIDGETTPLTLTLLAMITPWILGIVILAGYIVIAWKLPEFKGENLSAFQQTFIITNFIAGAFALLPSLDD